MVQVNQINVARKMNRRIQLNKFPSLLFLAATLIRACRSCRSNLSGRFPRYRLDQF